MQAHAFPRDQAIPLQKGGHSLQRSCLAPAQNVVEHEPQQAVVGPLAAFQEQNLALGEQQYPTRRRCRAEDAARHDVVPGLL